MLTLVDEGEKKERERRLSSSVKQGQVTLIPTVWCRTHRTVERRHLLSLDVMYVTGLRGGIIVLGGVF